MKLAKSFSKSNIRKDKDKEGSDNESDSSSFSSFGGSSNTDTSTKSKGWARFTLRGRSKKDKKFDETASVVDVDEYFSTNNMRDSRSLSMASGSAPDASFLGSPDTDDAVFVPPENVSPREPPKKKEEAPKVVKLKKERETPAVDVPRINGAERFVSYFFVLGCGKVLEPISRGPLEPDPMKRAYKGEILDFSIQQQGRPVPRTHVDVLPATRSHLEDFCFRADMFSFYFDLFDRPQTSRLRTHFPGNSSGRNA